MRPQSSRQRRVFPLLLCLLFLCLLLPSGVSSAQETTPIEGAIVSSSDGPTDREIEERLSRTFRALDALQGAAVTVNAGVVAISGVVATGEDAELAIELAKRVDGVFAVQNNIEVSQSVQMRLDTIRDQLQDKLWSFIAALPLFLVAVVVAVLFFWLARWVAGLELVFGWVSKSVFIRDLVQQVVRVAITACGLFLALEILDATALVGALLGAAGVVGLAVGFAFRDLVENHIASILLSIRQPFSPNDHIRIGDTDGKVVRLTSRATILITFDGNHVRIPNADVYKGTIVNFTRKNERRFEFQVGIANEVDIVMAENLALQVLGGIDGVTDDPGPSVLVKALGDSSVTLSIYGWVDQRSASYARVKSEAIRLVKEAFDVEGLEMPEPIQRVRLERMPKPKEVAKPSQPAVPARDMRPDRHLDEEVQAERAAEEADLLQADAPKE